MANFVCDICGGAIKMQANRTGVCQGCGMEYDLEAIKAMAGKPANTAANAVTPVQTAAPVHTSDSEIDRDALLIYLNDVKIMESVIHKCNQELDSDASYVKAHGKEYPAEPARPYPPGAPSKSAIFVSAFMMVVILLLSIGDYRLIVSYPEMKTIFVIALLVFIGFFIKAITMFVAAKKDYSDSIVRVAAYKRKAEDYQKEKAKYEEDKENEDYRYDKMMTNYRKRREIIKSDIEVHTELLKKAYEANIIPMQFRTIEGVYYLYDYLSTSNQTLSEALMQANLEAIKQKLDQMIQLQSVQIIEQAQTNAKLNEINETNNRILATAQQNARNSSLAAKYAAITAVNTAMIAQLNQKQLAYQRADFWLK